jgi:hypothetical protein
MRRSTYPFLPDTNLFYAQTRSGIHSSTCTLLTILAHMPAHPHAPPISNKAGP